MAFTSTLIDTLNVHYPADIGIDTLKRYQVTVSGGELSNDQTVLAAAADGTRIGVFGYAGVVGTAASPVFKSKVGASAATEAQRLYWPANIVHLERPDGCPFIYTDVNGALLLNIDQAITAFTFWLATFKFLHPSSR